MKPAIQVTQTKVSGSVTGLREEALLFWDDPALFWDAPGLFWDETSVITAPTITVMSERGSIQVI